MSTMAHLPEIHKHELSADGYCVRCGRRTSELECERVPSSCIGELTERIASLQAQVMLNRIVEQARQKR